MRVRQRVARVHLQEMILVFVQLCSSNVDMISTGTVRRAVPLREMNLLLPVSTQRYASAVLAMALCLSLSVTSWCSTETSERIEQLFWHGGIFRPNLHCIIRKLLYLQKCTFFWNFVPNSVFRKLRHAHHSTLIVATCCRLSSTKVNVGRDKLYRCRLSMLVILVTVDDKFITLIVHLCLQHNAARKRIARVGSSATADTCFDLLVMLHSCTVQTCTSSNI